MSNIQEIFNINEFLLNKIKNALVIFDEEIRFIFAYKNPENKLSEFGEIKDNNIKSLEALEKNSISKALGFNQVNKDILKEAINNSKNPKNLKIEDLSFDLFNELKERKLLRAFGELDFKDKNRIIKECWSINQIESFIEEKVKNICKKYYSNELNDKLNKGEIRKELEKKRRERMNIMEERRTKRTYSLNEYKQMKFKSDKILEERNKLEALAKKEFETALNNLIFELSSDEFLQKKAEFLVQNLDGTMGFLSEEEKNIFQNLDITIDFLNEEQQNILLGLSDQNLLALSEIEDLFYITRALSEVNNHISKLLDLDLERIKALGEIKRLNPVICELKDLTPELFKLDPEIIKALGEIKGLDLVIERLNEKNLTLELFKLDPERIKALAKIEDLSDVISKLVYTNKIHKLFDLSLKTLQDPQLIKEALGFYLEIKIKAENPVNTDLNLSASAKEVVISALLPS